MNTRETNHGSARTAMQATATALCLLVLAGCATKPEMPLKHPEPVWQQDFAHPVTFHTVIDKDLMVAGTSRHLFGIDPTSGKRLWRLRNVNTTKRDVIAVPGSPFILVNDAAGGAFQDRDTYMLAVDRRDGSLHWESPVVRGRILQVRVDFDRERVYATTVQGAHGDDTGMLDNVLPGKGIGSGFERAPALVAIDLNDGTQLWKRPFEQEIQMRPSYRPGVSATAQARVFDLGLYHEPVLVRDQVCVSYSGLHCYDGKTGKLGWAHEYDVVDWELGLSYPNPIVTEDRVIAGDTERLFGFKPLSGERQWRSASIGRMPELIDGGIMLYAQIGGRYFDLEEEEWEAHGDFGVAAFNKRNGNVLWNEDDLRESVSNIMVVEPYIWVADEHYLFALDRLDGSAAVSVPHEFEDAPTYVLLNQNRQVVLLSETEAAGFRRSDGKRLWYHHYESPGPGAWKQFAGALLSASGAIFKLSSTAVAYGSGLMPSMPGLSVAGAQLLGSDDVLAGTTGVIGDRLSKVGDAMNSNNDYANLTGHTRYFVTELDYYDEVALAAVDLDSGAKLALTALPTQTPNLVIDEPNARAYQSKGSTLFAMPLLKSRPQGARSE